MFKKLLILVFGLCILNSFSQTRRRNFRQAELGFLVGGSYYIGDLNSRSHFIYSKPAYGAFLRYSTNYRSAFRLGFNYGQIGASDAQSSQPNQIERNLTFESKLVEFHLLAEFNFVEYRIGNDKHRFTLFIFGGLSYFHFDPVTNASITEGVGYSKNQFSVPFGVGIKWNMGKFFGLGLEWGPRKTFTDYLDDVSGTYPHNLNTNGDGTAHNSQQGGVSPGAMRGDPSIKDWYFFYGLTLNIKLPNLHRTCHGSGK